MKTTQDNADLIMVARHIQWMFFDVDGVMTDGGLYYDAHGEALKRFNALDGHGLKAVQAAGIGVGILSGRSHPAVEARGRELGLGPILLGRQNKLEAFETWCASSHVPAVHCGHMGDDLPDLAVMAKVGLSASVCGGHPEVRAAARWVSTLPGGHGAVRELCDFILRSRVG